MYQFRSETDEKSFSDYVIDSGGPYFQLPNWQRVKTNWQPRFYCGYKDGEKVLSCLVLERKLPLCGKLWYAPCGFVGDYTDKTLVSEFSGFIGAEMKKNGAFAFVVDPPVPERIDEQPQPQSAPVIENLVTAGFRHNADNNNYTYQPTMTVMVDLQAEDGSRYTPETLTKKFEKGVRYSVRVGAGRGLRSESFTFADAERDGSLFDKFMDVMGDTTERLDILIRPRDYYYSFLREFAPWAVVDLVYYDKAADKANDDARRAEAVALEQQLAGETHEAKANKLRHRIEELETDSHSFEQRYKEACDYTDAERLYLAAGLTITFGDYACCVFGGTKNVLRNALRASHYLNFIRICRSMKDGVRLHDMGRVPHSYLDENSPEHGLYLFKMSFCAHLYEYVGEYTLVCRKLSYFNYYRLMPFVRNYRMRIIRDVKRLFRQA